MGYWDLSGEDDGGRWGCVCVLCGLKGSRGGRRGVAVARRRIACLTCLALPPALLCGLKGLIDLWAVVVALFLSLSLVVFFFSQLG